MPNLLQTLQTIWLHSSVFALEKYPKNATFSYFLPLKEPLVDTFNKACTLTSRKYVSKPDIIIPNLSDNLDNFRSHSSVFSLER